ncbi:MAG: shikimate dehydrogenase family protein [Acidimicrobiia bacterium]
MPPLRLAVLGDPIGHSRSPAIHGAAMAHLGIDGSYVARRVGAGEMGSVVAELRDGSLDGVNVTMPLKTEAAALADTLTPEAAASGSVNTMRLRSGAVEGHSTDVVASVHAFSDERFDPSAPVLILGAGGAAAAAIIGAAGREVYVAARDVQRATALVARIGIEAGVVPFGVGVSGALVVNATPLGMERERLHETVTTTASGIVDLAYGPHETLTVAGARAAGLPFMDGVEFLVLQAAASFEWWTGLPGPLDVMALAARKT